jgi:hypothetical protein
VTLRSAGLWLISATANLSRLGGTGDGFDLRRGDVNAFPGFPTPWRAHTGGYVVRDGKWQSVGAGGSNVSANSIGAAAASGSSMHLSAAWTHSRAAARKCSTSQAIMASNVPRGCTRLLGINSRPPLSFRCLTRATKGECRPG